MDWEGRKVHYDPDDPGGQTAWGIAREHWPNWEGWQLVDAGITSGPRFERAVSDFYRERAIRELLGVINYAAAAILVIKEGGDSVPRRMDKVTALRFHVRRDAHAD